MHKILKKEGFVNICALIVVYLIITFFFFYEDQITTIGHTVIFWKAILRGDFLGGYQECLDVIYSTLPHLQNTPAVYEPMAYIIMGIFSFPLIILNELGCLDFNSVWFNLYVKIQQLLLVGGSAFMVWKIGQELDMDKDRASHASFLFLSNIGIMYFAIAVGQLEIYACFFTLLGIYYWLRGKKGKFILFFAIAIPLKLFSALIFFPLILIQEKNAGKIILKFLSGCSIYLLSKLIWSSDTAYRISTAEPSQRMVDVIRMNQLAGGLAMDGEGIPIFVCLYLVMCFFLFTNKREDGKWGIYWAFVTYALMFIFIPSYPYWIVVLSPFLPLMIASNKRIEKFNLIADLVMWLSYLIATIFYHQWAAGTKMVNAMFLPYLFGRRTAESLEYTQVGELLNEYHLQKYAVFFVAIYVAAMVALIILNYPKEWTLSKIEVRESILHFLRIISIVPVLCLICYCYYHIKPELLIDTTQYESMDMGYNLLSQEAHDYGDRALAQKITLEKPATVNKIKLVFTRASNSFKANGILRFELRDVQNNELLYSERIGYNELIWGDFTVLKLGGIVLEGNHEYELLISNENFQDTSLPVYIKITNNNPLQGGLEYLGNEVGHDLFMKIEGKGD